MISSYQNFILGFVKQSLRLGIRFNNHKNSFRHWESEKDTELSKYIWELKDKHAEYQIRWSIAARK